MTDETIKTLPPTTIRAFSRDTIPKPEAAASTLGSGAKPKNAQAAGKLYVGLGEDMGPVETSQGTIEAGRMLFIDSWNAGLYGKLDDDWQQHKGDGKTLWFNKVSLLIRHGHRLTRQTRSAFRG